MPSKSVADKLTAIPDLPGAYVMKDAEGGILYVGKAKSLRKRLRQHFRKSNPPHGWAKQLYPRVADIDFTVTRSDLEALILEATLIKEHKPRYNIRLSDDKSYPYLRLTDELYPRLVVLRDLPADARVSLPGRVGKRRLHDPKRHEVHGISTGRLFGPYPTAGPMWRIIRLASELFGLRSCRRKLDGEPRGKPCLNLHIGRCLGPCRGAEVVPPEEYAETVRQAVRFLEGRSAQIAADLEAEMHSAAGAQEFERAARLRDKIEAITRATEGQVMVAPENRERDAIGIALEGDRALAVLFQVRAGRLVKQDQFAFEHVAGRAPGEVMDAFLTQHYSSATHVPAEVIVSEAPEDIEIWAELLAEARGGNVRIYRPQRGEKRRLVELAAKNARVGLLAIEKGRAQQEQGAALALADLAEALGLPEPPGRIECFDISTTQGRDSTGSQVVFTAGRADKGNYRRYRMRATEGKADDYAMMAEMLRRRLRRGLAGDEKFLPLPDLILVDGGKGQIGAALEVLADEGVPGIATAGLAKRNEDVYLPGRPQPEDMAEHQAAHYLLQRVRDEAHRFAITHHRGLRDSQITRSVLDDVSGIGPSRKRALLAAFPSVQAMAHATVDELAAVPGMNKKVAEGLLRHLIAGDEGEAE